MTGLRQLATAGVMVVGIGLVPTAAPSAQSREPLVRAIQLSRGARIGVSLRDVASKDGADSKTARETGVIVDTVDQGGPADKAGIKAGDTIVEFDGERVRSAMQFSRLVQETPGGRAVTVALLRNGQRTSLTVTPEDRSWNDDFSMRLLDVPRVPPPPAAPVAPAAPRLPRVPSIVTPTEPFRLLTGRRLGITMETLDDQLAQYFGVKEGVLVKAVAADTPAEKAGLKAGDVITAVNGRQIYETADVARALDRMENADEFTIAVLRDKKPVTITGKLEARARPRISMF
jgi:serine protease Do